MPVDMEVKVEGIKELIHNLDKFNKVIETRGESALEKAAINTADDIKVVFKGGSSPGFKDDTGALRASIRGGVDQTIKQSEGDIVSFVGAGDETIGSEGKPTRDYVTMIEFGEFSKAGKTSFLRAGVRMSQNQIFRIILDELDIERLVR